MLEIIVGAVANMLYDLLNREFRKYVNQLRTEEKASEILVGFDPRLSAEKMEKEVAVTSTSDSTSILQSVNRDVTESAVNFLSKLQPTKSESNLPGLNSVEQDLVQLRAGDVDSSWLTNIVRITATPSMIGKLARSKQVAFVAPNFEMNLPSPVEVQEAELKEIRQQEENQKRTWGIDFLKVQELWDQGLTGEGVLIGHLDTGVDAGHPDLNGKVKDFALFDPRGQHIKCEPFDSGHHGTHTAGTIVGGDRGGVSIGVAPSANLVSALALMGGRGNTWQIIKGLEWLISQKVRIINMSLGGIGYNRLYEYALQRAVATGVFISCAIGNEGLAVTGSPGNLDLACGVGAIDPTGEVAEFSGGGSIRRYNSLGQLEQVHKPDLVAPGTAIRSAMPQGSWDYANGTSMAAPHVSGVIALMVQAKPSAPLQHLLRAIYSTARHPNTSEERQDSVFGRGIINPIQALEQLERL